MPESKKPAKKKIAAKKAAVKIPVEAKEEPKPEVKKAPAPAKAKTASEIRKAFAKEAAGKAKDVAGKAAKGAKAAAGQAASAAKSVGRRPDALNTIAFPRLAVDASIRVIQTCSQRQAFFRVCRKASHFRTSSNTPRDSAGGPRKTWERGSSYMRMN